MLAGSSSKQVLRRGAPGVEGCLGFLFFVFMTATSLSSSSSYSHSQFVFPLYQAVRRLERREMSETFELWQIKLVLEFFSSRSHQERMSRNPNRGLFMNSEFLPVMKCTIDNTLDQWLQGIEQMTLILQLWSQFSILVFLLICIPKAPG